MIYVWPGPCLHLSFPLLETFMNCFYLFPFSFSFPFMFTSTGRSPLSSKKERSEYISSSSFLSLLKPRFSLRLQVFFEGKGGAELFTVPLKTAGRVAKICLFRICFFTFSGFRKLSFYFFSKPPFAAAIAANARRAGQKWERERGGGST